MKNLFSELKSYPKALGISAIALIFATPLTAQEPNFGRAVAMTPTDLIIGQPVNWYGPGTVYAYTANEDGWDEPQLLTAPDSSRMDDFGRAIVLEGNTMAVGTPRKHDQAGAVYVFTRSGSTSAWEIAATIMSPGSETTGQMGTTLALQGNDLLVGAPSMSSSGVVYHYKRSGDTWTLEGTINPENEAGGFGSSLAWDGDNLLVGAPTSDDRRGAVYATSVLANGQWGEAKQIDLVGAASNESAQAGTSMVLTNGQALVGAPGTASVAVLERSGTELGLTPKLLVRQKMQMDLSSASRSASLEMNSGSVHPGYSVAMAEFSGSPSALGELGLTPATRPRRYVWCVLALDSVMQSPLQATEPSYQCQPATSAKAGDDPCPRSERLVSR